MNDDTRATTSTTTSVSSSPSTSSATESSTPYTDLPTSSSPAVDKEAAEIGKVPQSSQVAFISAQRQLVPPSNNYTSTPRTLASLAEFTPLPTPSDHHSVQPDVIDHQTSDNRTNHEKQGDPRRHDLSPTRLNRVDSTDIDRARSSTPIHTESGSKLQDDQPVLTRTTITDRHGSEEHSSGEASDRSDKPALQNDVTVVNNRIEHTRSSPTGEASLLGDSPSRLPTASTSSSDTETIRAVVEENGEITSDALPTNEARGSFSSTRTTVTTLKQQHSKLSTLARSQSPADDPSEQRSIGRERDSFPVEQRSPHHDSHTIIITSPDSATSRKTDLPPSFHVPGQGDRQSHQDTPGHPPSQAKRHNRTTDTEDLLPKDIPFVTTQPIPAINFPPSDISVAATPSRLSLPPTSSSSSSLTAVSEDPTEVFSQPGLRESPSQGVAQGGGMNEGPGLVADSGRSIRGYGAAPGPDYNSSRPYSADYRAGIDQSIPYAVPTGYQHPQGVVREGYSGYSGSHFQRYPGAPGENINKASLALSTEPLKTKIKPKGRGKRKAEQVVQVEVETGGVPNPSYPPPQRNGAGVNPTEPLGSGRNMEVQINHDYAAGNAPPPYDDYAYPANGLPSSTSYDPAQGFSSPSGQGPLFPPQPSNGSHHLSQSNYSVVGPPSQNLEQSPQTQRPHEHVPAGPSYNAMAGPSNPYLQGLPPAIQSQMPGGADYGSLPVGVSGGKIFKCMGFPGCEMTFTRSEHLARHVRKHTGERPFPCHCGKAFSRLDNLRQHAATVHNDSVDLNDRMLRALAPVHAALSQRAGKEQRQRGEVLSVPKTAAERAKSVQPKKPKKTAPRGVIVEGNGGPGPMQMMQSPHHFGPEMPPPPPVLIPGQPGFQLQHPISSSITSNPDVVAHYPTQMVPPPAGGPLHAMPMSHPQAHQPHPPPWFPPHATIEGQRPESSYRPGTDGRPGTGYASHQTSAGVSPHLPNPPQSSSLSGYGNYVRSPQEHPPAGFQYEPFPHGIRPGSKHPVSLQLHHPPRSAGPTMGAGHSAASVDGRFSDRPGTASSPYLQIPTLTSAPPYAPTYAHAQPPSAGAQLSFSPHPPRSSHPAEIYQQHPGTAPSSGRPGTGILQHQQQQSMPLHSGPYQSSHGSSGHSSRLTGNSSQHSMGRVTHQQIQEIYGNSGATQESPFSYHPPPTATQPPPTQYSFGSGVPDYGVQSHGFQPDLDVRKRKTEELDSDAYDTERRKGQKTELGKVATGVFYPGRAERRNSLAISSLITGDGQTQIQPPPEHGAMAPDYGNGYYQDNGEPGISDQHNMASYTFGNVGGPDYGYNAGAQPSYMLEEQQQQQHLQSQPHGAPGKPGHHAMDVKARALLDNGGYDV